jgi:hypothetical protein
MVLALVQTAESKGLDIAWVNPPLLLGRGLRGRSYEVMIGGRTVTLTLPSEGLKQIDSTRPRPRGPLPRFPPLRLARPITHGSHIYTSSARPVSDPVFAVGAVRLRLQGDLEETFMLGSAFGDELGAWLDIARSWLAAWSGNLHTSAYLEPPPPIRAAQVGQADGVVDGHGGETPVFMLGLRTSTPMQLRAAFAAASRSAAIPLERQLLAEARLDAARARYRHAVINACTAAEVALSESARASLSRAGRPPKEVDKILRGASGVVDLYRLNAHRAQGLGVSIGHVSDQLAGPRNAAAHAGESLDEDTTRKAVQTAQRLLNAVAPVPKPQSLLKRQSTGSRAS